MALLSLWAALAALLVVSLRQNDGHLVYALDDAYIHLAMARNLAQYGVWGVSRYAFTSTSSSPLWTLGLAAIFRLLGPHEAVSLALNVALSTALVWWVYATLRRRGLGSWPTALTLLGVIFLTPLPTLAFTGLEHVLQTLLVLAFADLLSRVLAGKARWAWLLALAPLVTLVRYEGLFLVGVAGFLLLTRRRWRHALALAVVGLLPLALSGAVSAAHGWPWLPTSIMLKGNLPRLAFPAGILLFLGRAGVQLLQAAHLLVLMAVAALMWIRQRPGPRRAMQQPMLAVFLGVAALHVLLAAVGWFYRYEAYLVALGLVAIAMTQPDWPAVQLRRVPAVRRLSLGLVVVIVLEAPLIRGVSAVAAVPQATADIYGQQYQMAAFLNAYYPGAAVAANDIGAISYYTDTRCLDLYGLSDLDVAMSRLRGELDQERIAELTASGGVRVAVIYEAWFDGALPEEWVKVGEWRLTRVAVVPVDTVSFFAVDPAEAPRLEASLRAFAPRLPSDVEQRLFGQDSM